MTTMKNHSQMLKAVVLPISMLLLLYALSCKRAPIINCHLSLNLSEPIEIQFNDTVATQFILSPLEPNKVWVKKNSGKLEIWEIDALTKQQKMLEKKFWHFFIHDSYELKDPPFLCQDNIDSLVWAGGPNRELIQYDKKTKTMRTFPLSYVTRIISKPDYVYFVALKGFYFWDRKKDVVEKVPGIPMDYIQSSTMPNEGTIILEDKYTYDFNSGKAKKGVYLGEYHHEGELFSFKAQNGVYLFYDKDHILSYLNEKKIKVLPVPESGLGQTDIYKNTVWQHDNRYFYKYDTKA